MKLRIKKSLVNSVWLFAIWPIFLFVSQKLLILIQVFNVRLNSYRRISFIGALFCFLMVIFMSLITLNFGSFNNYSIRHFISFTIFLIYALLIAGVLTIERHSNHMLRLISLINFISLVAIHFIYFYEIELPGNRGLNFIRGTDNEIHRFYVETSPIFLISRFGVIKNRFLKIIFIGLTLSYFFWISKTTFLTVLFLLQLVYRYHKYFRLYHFGAGVMALAILTAVGGLKWSSFFRADLLFSIFFKLEQLSAIVGKIGLNNVFFGEGFGFYIKNFATDLEQPYQLEMQLPMLILQLGMINCLMLVLGIFFLFKSVRVTKPLLATGLFFSVGIINPWLFLPVWLISSIYFFK